MNPRLQFMLDIIRKIGDFQHKNFRTEIEFETKAGEMDIVSFVDRESEKMFHDAVNKIFPGDYILGEETYVKDYDYAQHTKLWIIDPLDGTLMYQRWIPNYCPMIAYVENGIVQMSALYFPQDDTLFHADRTWAYKNSQQIHVSEINTLSKGIFNVSTRTLLKRFTYEQIKNITQSLGRIIDTCPTWNKLRMCLEGQNEWVISLEWGVWDTVPGWFLIQQAGGKVTNFWSDTWDIFNPKVIFSNGIIHAEFQKLLEL